MGRAQTRRRRRRRRRRSKMSLPAQTWTPPPNPRPPPLKSSLDLESPPRRNQVHSPYASYCRSGCSQLIPECGTELACACWRV
eukprot:3088130-Rhodomonas_salina.1